MKIIGVTLYVSDEANAGRLTWHNDRNLGFPVPDGARNLIPKKKARQSGEPHAVHHHKPRRRQSKKIT